MNLGSKILELRRQKNVTQEDMAAELGVTAAAVSKWENGYTLPDVLMLCALADFFAVTTDELLGREKEPKYAVIAAQTPELGEKIKALASDYGIIANAIYSTYPEAREHLRNDSTVKMILISLENPPSESRMKEASKGLIQISVCCDTIQETLDNFSMYFQHMDLFYSHGEKNNRKMCY